MAYTSRISTPWAEHAAGSHAERHVGEHPFAVVREIDIAQLDGQCTSGEVGTGTVGIIYPGLAQRMSAGSGITHSEMNASATADVHLVQMWVLPDTEGLPPGYEQRSVGEALATGELVPVASGRGHDGAITIHQKDAVLWVGRLAAGKTVTVPDAPHVHVYVARGSVTLDEAGELGEGDAARLTDAGSPSLTAGPDGTEVIIWQTA